MFAPLLGVALAEDGAEDREPDQHRVGFVAGTLIYVPNRFLDLVDIVRFRARLGPGVGIGVRATEWADVYAGIYGAAYVGLPGPRNRKLPKLPIGIESKSGVEISKADVSTSLFLFDPDYGDYEFGLDAQVLIVGGAVGFDPAELLDFFGGFVLADPRRDDLLYRGPDEERPRRRGRSASDGSESTADEAH